MASVFFASLVQSIEINFLPLQAFLGLGLLFQILILA